MATGEDRGQFRGQLYRLFGGQGDVTGEGELIEQIRAIGGPSPRTKSGIDLTKAAVRLGIKPRTLRGWVNEGRHPSGKSARKVRTVARRVGNTKAGRQAAVTHARGQGRFTQVRGISVTGLQGPTRSGTDYLRERTVHRTLTAEQVEELAAAYEAGGDADVRAWVEQEMQGYLPGWGIDSFNTPGGGLDFEER